MEPSAELAAANALFVDGDYEAALARYDAAVAAQPESAEAHIKRAACHDKLGRHDAALKDADAAVALAPASAAAHHHRGTALLRLERYPEARKALREAQRLLGGGPMHTSVLGVIKAQLAEVKEKEGLQREAPEGVAHVSPPRAVTTDSAAPVTTITAGPVRPLSPGVGEVSDAVAAMSPFGTAVTTTATGAPADAAAGGGAPRPPRFDWYQSLSHVTVTVWVKGAVEGASSVMVADQRLEASLTTADGGVHTLALRLYAPISADAPMAVAYRPTKVEVRMPKAAAGMWPCLQEGDAATLLAGGAAAPPPVASSAVSPSSAPVSPPTTTATTTTGGGVPSAYSSKKDWSKVEKALGGEDAPEDESSLEGFFKGLYARADDDARRAMVKSFVSRRAAAPRWLRCGVTQRRETTSLALSLPLPAPSAYRPQTQSGGLSLSTDWKDAAKKDFAEEARRLAAEKPPRSADDDDT